MFMKHFHDIQQRPVTRQPHEKVIWRISAYAIVKSKEGKILLLEDTHEPINTVYRYINHLKLAGKFDDCIGILMGECSNCEIAYGKTYNDLIDEVLVPLGKPLISNLATGHGPLKAAIPIGTSLTMNTETLTLTVMEPAVSV